MVDQVVVVPPVISQAEAEAGTSTEARLITAERLAQAIAALESGDAVDSVNGMTGTVVLDADDISDAATTNKFTTAADISKLAGISAGAEVNPDVVSQAEAEAGVATTERIWTAERVNQAIQALASSTDLTRSFTGTVNVVGRQDDWDLNAYNARDILECLPSGGGEVGGIDADTSGFVDGDIITLMNKSTNTLTILHQDSNSTNGYRIETPDTQDIVLNENEMVTLCYDESDNWVVLSTSLSVPFKKIYQSTGQTITSAGLLTLAHGLGEAPKLITAYIKCTSADAGYAVNDEVMVTLVVNTSPSNGRAQGVYFDATNIYIRFSDETTVFRIGNKTTGNATGPDNADWDLYIVAWA